MYHFKGLLQAGQNFEQRRDWIPQSRWRRCQQGNLKMAVPIDKSSKQTMHLSNTSNTSQVPYPRIESVKARLTQKDIDHFHSQKEGFPYFYLHFITNNTCIHKKIRLFPDKNIEVFIYIGCLLFYLLTSYSVFSQFYVEICKFSILIFYLIIIFAQLRSQCMELVIA